MDRVLGQIQERFETDKPDNIGKFLVMAINQPSDGTVTATSIEYVEKTEKRWVCSDCLSRMCLWPRLFNYTLQIHSHPIQKNITDTQVWLDS